MDSRVAAATSLAVYLMISAPSIIHCGYQLHRHSNEQYLIKRRISIITAFYIIVLLDVTFLGLSAMSHLFQSQYVTSKRVMVGVDYTLIWTMIAIFATRVWLLFFGMIQPAICIQFALET